MWDPAQQEGADSSWGEAHAGHIQHESREAPRDARGPPQCSTRSALLPGKNSRGTNLSSREATWFGEEKFWIQGTPLLLNSCVTLGKLLFL